MLSALMSPSYSRSVVLPGKFWGHVATEMFARSVRTVHPHT